MIAEMAKKTVVIGLAGPTLDARGGKDRWQRWRPTVSIGQHDDLLVDRFELLCQEKYLWLGEQLATDFKQVSPDTEVNIHPANFPKPWDFGAVYAELLDSRSITPLIRRTRITSSTSRPAPM